MTLAAHGCALSYQLPEGWGPFSLLPLSGLESFFRLKPFPSDKLPCSHVVFKYYALWITYSSHVKIPGFLPYLLISLQPCLKKKKKPRQNSPFPHSLEPWPPISLRTCMCVHSCHPTALTEFSSRSQLFPSAPFKPPLIRTNLAMSQNMTSPNFLFSLIKYFLHRQLTKEVDYLFLK